MKKLLTVALVFVFALALMVALGCNKKEEAPATEGATSGMETTTPADGGMAMDTTAMAAPDTAAAAGTTH
jgi:hypothetical protein